MFGDTDNEPAEGCEGWVGERLLRYFSVLGERGSSGRRKDGRGSEAAIGGGGLGN